MKIFKSILISFLALTLSSCLEMKEETVEIGYKGKARLDPFLAAKRFLENKGEWIEKTGEMLEPPDTSDTMVLAAESLKSANHAQVIADWVYDGGHLIFLLDGGIATNDWRNGADTVRIPDNRSNDDENYPLLKIFGLSISSASHFEISDKIIFFGNEFHIRFATDKGILHEKGSKADAFSNSVNGVATFLSLRHGSGRLNILCHAHPIRNRNIGDNDHAHFLWNLCLANPYSTIWWVDNAGPSFYSLLWETFWMPIAGILFLTILWIWKNTKRTAPILDPHERTGDFLNHIEKSGEFLWTHHCAEDLLTPLRKNVRTRYRETFLTDFDSRNENDLQRLTERSGIQKPFLIEAFEANPKRDEAYMLRVTQNLQKILYSL